MELLCYWALCKIKLISDIAYEGSVIISYNQPAPNIGNDNTKANVEEGRMSRGVYKQTQTHEGSHTIAKD